jgi:hypothetical protein
MSHWTDPLVILTALKLLTDLLHYLLAPNKKNPNRYTICLHLSTYDAA